MFNKDLGLHTQNIEKYGPNSCLFPLAAFFFFLLFNLSTLLQLFVVQELTQKLHGLVTALSTMATFSQSHLMRRSRAPVSPCFMCSSLCKKKKKKKKMKCEICALPEK